MGPLVPICCCSRMPCGCADCGHVCCPPTPPCACSPPSFPCHSCSLCRSSSCLASFCTRLLPLLPRSLRAALNSTQGLGEPFYLALPRSCARLQPLLPRSLRAALNSTQGMGEPFYLASPHFCTHLSCLSSPAACARRSTAPRAWASPSTWDSPPARRQTWRAQRAQRAGAASAAPRRCAATRSRARACCQRSELGRLGVAVELGQLRLEPAWAHPAVPQTRAARCSVLPANLTTAQCHQPT